MDTHYINKGDTLTPLGAQLKQKGSSGTYDAVDLTSRDVKFKMVAEDGTVKVAETASNVSKTDASSGKVQYDFQAADVDTAGVYYAWFMVYAGTEKDTYPADGRSLKIVISDTDDY